MVGPLPALPGNTVKFCSILVALCWTAAASAFVHGEFLNLSESHFPGVSSLAQTVSKQTLLNSQQATGTGRTAVKARALHSFPPASEYRAFQWRRLPWQVDFAVLKATVLPEGRACHRGPT